MSARADRADLHTDSHEKWDQGGYCNNLVVDHDGTGVVCGYRETRTPVAPPEERVRLAYAQLVSVRYGTLRKDAVADFNAFIAKTKADAIRDVATGFIDWNVVHGHSSETEESKRGFENHAYLEREADRIERGER